MSIEDKNKTHFVWTRKIGRQTACGMTVLSKKYLRMSADRICRVTCQTCLKVIKKRTHIVGKHML